MSDFRYVEVTNMRQTEVMVVWTAPLDQFTSPS